MDVSWLSGVALLVFIFTSVSATGALRRIADATERAAADVEKLVVATQSNAQP